MAIESNVGARLKQRREEIDISLRKLAQKTGLSASFLSQVERCKANLSLNSLEKIANALEVPLLYFLSEEPLKETISYDQQINSVQSSAAPVEDHPRYNPVVRSTQRSKLILPLTGVSYEMLVPNLGQDMLAIMGRISPGTDENIARPLREPTEEFIYVFSGKLLLELDSGSHYLNANDSIYFEGKSLLKLACASEQEDTVWLSVITPPVF